jgi:uncharacterized membrane protein
MDNRKETDKLLYRILSIFIGTILSILAISLTSSNIKHILIALDVCASCIIIALIAYFISSWRYKRK